MRRQKLFDPWPETYDQWFTTPIGSLVKKYESALILDLLEPASGEITLDAGCGTGVFTRDILSAGARVIGLDISVPMLGEAKRKLAGTRFQAVKGDLLYLPFPADSFDRVISVTALEFIEDGVGAFRELFRVSRKGGSIVVATLNSLSPWAARRRAEAKEGHPLFKEAIFRSPDDLSSLAPVRGLIRTCIHFGKEDDPAVAAEMERRGEALGLATGAFLAGRWRK